MSDETYLLAVLDNKNGADVHVIRIEYPGVNRHQAVCACGKYRSKTYGYAGLAQVAGDTHVRAKESSR